MKSKDEEDENSRSSDAAASSTGNAEWRQSVGPRRKNTLGRCVVPTLQMTGLWPTFKLRDGLKAGRASPSLSPCVWTPTHSSVTYTSDLHPETNDFRLPIVRRDVS